MEKKKSIGLIMVALIMGIFLIKGFVCSGYAETIILKTGKRVEGNIIEKTDKYLKIDFQGIPLTYYFDEIESVHETEQNLPLTKEEKSSQENNLPSVSNKAMEEYYSRGIIYYKQGNFSQAISDFTKAIEINPNYAETYHNRGIVYAAQGNFSQAISDYSKAIEINPNHAVAYNNRAVNYYKIKEYDKAWLDVNKAVALRYAPDPGFIEALKRASGRNKVELQNQQESQVSSAGRDGSSFEKAIIIKYIGSHKESIDQEYTYLKTKFGIRGKDWRLVKQNFRDKEGKVYDEMIVELLPSKKTVILYFDITEPWKELSKEYP